MRSTKLRLKSRKTTLITSLITRRMVILSVILIVFGGCALNPDLAPDKYVLDGGGSVPSPNDTSDFGRVVVAFIVGAVVGYVLRHKKII